MSSKSAREVRTKLLERSDEIINAFVDVALGLDEEFKGSPQLLETAFKAIVPDIRINDDLVDLSKLSDDSEGTGKPLNAYKDKVTYVNAVLSHMHSGEITSDQANLAISAIEKATNVIEIQEIVKKLNALEGDDTNT